MRTPSALKKGSHIRVIAPSRSASILSEEGMAQAKKRLEALGFTVSFGQHVFECDLHSSSSIEHRLSDLHEAFSNDEVDGILTAIGGFNCNELLPYIDYNLIRQHPKVLCGYSDITALANVITAKCDMVTYSGPHFSSFQMEQGQEKQTAMFQACVMSSEPFDVTPSTKWSDDAWYLDQANRQFHPTTWGIYQEGTGEGTLYGGNLCTLNLLQGTPFMPRIKDAILFVEDDDLVFPETFARDLASLLQHAESIKGLIIGRFQKKSKMTEEHLRFILDKHPMLQHIPVIYDVDIGHTQPVFTLPIGGSAELSCDGGQIQWRVHA
ncbi:S66 family peptidase [Bacillus altitudinis]|uniref:S66 family peptidase n=1 Tax=Bacillus altitudinis TaxID=293387 RepID=UPI001FB7BA18|nr:S66 peptidase family protein [Bacillus altitudinis]UOG07406.1 LD-carboxypeptidase [Bacillus altitudinis]